MKRIALVFLIAILLPAALLAVLAVRSVKDQEMIANSQRANAYQAACEARAADINLFMDDVRIFYGQLVDEFVEGETGGNFFSFNRKIRNQWGQAAVGACVGDGGQLLSPRQGEDEQVITFLKNHADFLTNRRVVEVYEAPGLLNSQIQVVAQEQSPSAEEAQEETDSALEPDESAKDSFAQRTERKTPWKVEASQNKLQYNRFERQQSNDRSRVIANMGGRDEDSAAPDALEMKESEAEAVTPPGARANRGVEPGDLGSGASGWEAEEGEDSVATPSAVQPQNDHVVESRALEKRTVAPAQYGAAPEWSNLPQQEMLQDLNYSKLSVDNVRFNDLAETEKEGAVSRIIDGELHVLLWKRPEQKPDHVFWVELDMEQIQRDIEPLFAGPRRKLNSLAAGLPEISLALLSADGNPVVQTVKGFETDWSRPFVAAEVGQILPRWEVAAYLLNPNAVSQSARTVRLLIVWLVGLSLVAVAVGSLLIFRSVNYEMRMATRKTDFVSNVSHELKTPLTSIRMFSDLLAQSEQVDTERTRKYSEVISKESARLGRLIHRLLDFSRLERGEMPLDQIRIDLTTLVPETVEQYRPHMQAEGIELEVETGGIASLPVVGDSDAIAQVLLNLLSNAEKYGAKGKEILVEIDEDDQESIVRVHDRGPGIPRGQQKKIFEKFYRVDESIDSGIEGSGIGLALSRQIMERLGGALHYEPRSGGGSTFSIRLPKATS